MYKLGTGVFMYKYSKSSLPDGFNNFFTTRSEIHDYHIDIKIIIMQLEILEPFWITQSELMDQYLGIHLITTSESQIR